MSGCLKIINRKLKNFISLSRQQANSIGYICVIIYIFHVHVHLAHTMCLAKGGPVGHTRSISYPWKKLTHDVRRHALPTSSSAMPRSNCASIFPVSSAYTASRCRLSSKPAGGREEDDPTLLAQPPQAYPRQAAVTTFRRLRLQTRPPRRVPLVAHWIKNLLTFLLHTTKSNLLIQGRHVKLWK